LDIDGARAELAAAGVVAASAMDPRHANCPSITLIALPKGSLRLQLLALVIQPEFYAADKPLPVDGFSVGGLLLEGRLLARDFKIAGLLLGTLRLDEAGVLPGESVRGTLRAELYRMPP
jgi:hypothetical protein